MAEAATFRVAQDDDMPSAYRVFRRSIFGHLHRTGLATAEEAADPPVASSWARQEAWIRHLWATAAANWVATDGDGEVVGWALSVERAGHLELALFFVDPACSARGVGARLLSLAFAALPATDRTIVATHDPAALSLYLRSGVTFRATCCDIRVRARSRPVAPGAGLVLRRADPADPGPVAEIEAQVLGLHRDTDLRFLLGNRPAWIALRDGRPAGYAFGAEPVPAGATDHPPVCGPVAALDPADLPALLDAVLDAAPAGSELSFAVPLGNGAAIAHLLGQGGRMDPFLVSVLSSSDRMRFDRYVLTSPSFIV